MTSNINSASNIKVRIQYKDMPKSILVINPNSTVSMTDGLKPLIDALNFKDVRQIDAFIVIELVPI